MVLIHVGHHVHDDSLQYGPWGWWLVAFSKMSHMLIFFKTEEIQIRRTRRSHVYENFQPATSKNTVLLERLQSPLVHLLSPGFDYCPAFSWRWCPWYWSPVGRSVVWHGLYCSWAQGPSQETGTLYISL